MCLVIKGVCHHEWCYLCLEPYLHDATGMLYCHHKEDCPDRELDTGPLFEAAFPADDGARDGPRRVPERPPVGTLPQRAAVRPSRRPGIPGHFPPTLGKILTRP